MKETTTNRGFALIEFEDRSGNKCQLQKSSIATEDAIWFGVEDPEMQIMAKDAHIMGISTPTKVGWIEVRLPEEVSVNTRMHLTREQVAEILPNLQKFVETGEI